MVNKEFVHHLLKTHLLRGFILHETLYILLNNCFCYDLSMSLLWHLLCYSLQLHYSRSFSDGDGVCSAEVFSTNVMVNTNAGNHDHGSSKVKLKNLVDYNWEPKFYAGQLLAIHTSGKYLAYSIKGMTLIRIFIYVD